MKTLYNSQSVKVSSIKRKVIVINHTFYVYVFYLYILCENTKKIDHIYRHASKLPALYSTRRKKKESFYSWACAGISMRGEYHPSFTAGMITFDGFAFWGLIYVKSAHGGCDCLPPGSVELECLNSCSRESYRLTQIADGVGQLTAESTPENKKPAPIKAEASLCLYHHAHLYHSGRTLPKFAWGWGNQNEVSFF